MPLMIIFNLFVAQGERTNLKKVLFVRKKILEYNQWTIADNLSKRF